MFLITDCDAAAAAAVNTGEDGSLFSSDLLRGSDVQDSRIRLRLTPRCLSAQRLEHHGLCRRRHRVGIAPHDPSVCPSFCLTWGAM